MRFPLCDWHRASFVNGTLRIRARTRFPAQPHIFRFVSRNWMPNKEPIGTGRSASIQRDHMRKFRTKQGRRGRGGNERKTRPPFLARERRCRAFLFANDEISLVRNAQVGRECQTFITRDVLEITNKLISPPWKCAKKRHAIIMARVSVREDDRTLSLITRFSFPRYLSRYNYAIR